MKSIVISLATGITALAILALSGCETSPASSEITISPSTATIRTGESVTFTASGGYDYRWAVETPAYGTLSSLTGSTVTYTSTHQFTTNATTTVSQKLTVTSYIAGTTTTAPASTNTTTTTTEPTRYEVTTEAIITHLPPEA